MKQSQIEINRRNRLKHKQATRVARNYGNPWSEHDREFLLANARKIKAVDMARCLGRTYDATVQMLRELRRAK